MQIESDNLNAEDLTNFISTPANDSEEKKAITAARKKDKGKDLNSTKVRATTKCTCSAVCAKFSNDMAGNQGALSTSDLAKLERSLEMDVYYCGDKVTASCKLFYSWRALRCGQSIEAVCYNPSIGAKGGRTV